MFKICKLILAELSKSIFQLFVLKISFKILKLGEQKSVSFFCTALLKASGVCTKAVARRCSVKNMFLKISQIRRKTPSPDFGLV